MPITSFGNERESLFKEGGRSIKIVLPTRSQCQSGPVACLPFEIAQFFCQGETILKCLGSRCPFAQVQVNFALCAVEVQECAGHLVRFCQLLTLCQGALGRFELPKQ